MLPFGTLGGHRKGREQEQKQHQQLGCPARTNLFQGWLKVTAYPIRRSIRRCSYGCVSRCRQADIALTQVAQSFARGKEHNEGQRQEQEQRLPSVRKRNLRSVQRATRGNDRNLPVHANSTPNPTHTIVPQLPLIFFDYPDGRSGHPPSQHS